MNLQAFFQQAQFMGGAADLSQLPPDEGAEVAFAGRSNSGKSSAINALTLRRSLARTSKSPGRTQQINFFQLDAENRLVDLPGYGYAKVAQAMKRRWQHTLSEYLQQRQCLKALVLVMDVRHPLTDYDQQMLAWCQSSNLAVLILLTKTDKLNQSERQKQLKLVNTHCTKYKNKIDVILFSATKKLGLNEARTIIAIKLGLN
ncbi:MAG TPA: YihA family ribosome biogenesis GTP-binding protein [Gammaproteobacteria bacterium]|nr:YihA family ribosome biogenesis GTP-binding protein [Gammaproteobacteria bacterium]